MLNNITNNGMNLYYTLRWLLSIFVVKNVFSLNLNLEQSNPNYEICYKTNNLKAPRKNRRNYLGEMRVRYKM